MILNTNIMKYNTTPPSVTVKINEMAEQLCWIALVCKDLPSSKCLVFSFCTIFPQLLEFCRPCTSFHLFVLYTCGRQRETTPLLSTVYYQISTILTHNWPNPPAFVSWTKFPLAWQTWNVHGIDLKSAGEKSLSRDIILLVSESHFFLHMGL